MLFIIWLSLRNLSHLLPLPIQNAIQDISDRLHLHIRSHIRLLDPRDTAGNAGGNYSRRYHPQQQQQGIPFNLDPDDASSEDDDDELPLVSLSSHNDDGPSSYFGKAGRSRKLDRMVRLFSGTGTSQRSRGYGQLGNADTHEEDEESVLDLPNLSASTQRFNPNNTERIRQHRQQQQQQRNPPNIPPHPSILFQASTHENDASPLPTHFSPFTSPIKGPLSPSLERGIYPRSPLRSPSLSRTPSLVAIVEETSVSPRSSTDQQRRQQDHEYQDHRKQLVESPTSEPISRIGSGSGSTESRESREIQDWASARSFATQHH
jgi:hypothetical protein